MKKLTITAVALLACVSVYAQGTVLFQNSATTQVRTNAAGGGGLLPTGTTFLLDLYWAADGADPGNDGMIRISDAATGLFGPGRYNGGVETTPAGVPPTGTPGGGFAWFQVRAWESAFGSTHEAAKANAVPQNGRLAYVGTSNRFRIQTGAPPGPAAPLVQVGGLAAFDVSIVPEPSAIALGLLGLGSLLMLRRRK